MAAPRSFVSFDYDHDSASRVLFTGQAKKDSPTPFTAEDWSSKSTLPQAQWEAAIKAKVNTCHMLIVLVGRHMGTASGVVKEIKMGEGTERAGLRCLCRWGRNLKHSSRLVFQGTVRSRGSGTASRVRSSR